MIVAIVLLVIFLLILVGGLLYWNFKLKNRKVVDRKGVLDFIFNKVNFAQDDVLYVDKNLILAINKNETKFAIVKNLNFDNPKNYYIEIVKVPYVVSIKDCKTHLEINYISDGVDKKLKVKSTSKKTKKFVHNLFKKSCYSIIKTKYPENEFKCIHASNWQCDYIWAFDPKNCIFVYYDLEKHFTSYKINLLKTNLTLDVKYSYLEMSIYNINQQLLVYNNEFYDELYNSIMQKIKEKYAIVKEDVIYYDNNNNVVYLCNGLNSLQIINIDTVEEVFYHDNKLSFSISESNKPINFLASKNLIYAFEQFVISLNIRKIAQNFNYSLDKLINTAENTKLIIDITRSRIVYCANLNTFSKFGYFVISFDSIRDVEYNKHGSNPFVRIYINKKDIIDVSCNKKSIAEYIMAQIKTIINDRKNI